LADIELRRTHALGMAGARAAADRIAADLGQRFGLHGEWRGNTLHFERPGVSGALRVAERELHLTIALGLLLKAMQGPIERAVTAELDGLSAASAPAKKARGRPRRAG
jgi:putative polyhydroxyalkanoate system protein